MKKVVLGFSGGVDSAVSAVLLREAGYDVQGVYLNNSSESDLSIAEDTASSMGLPLSIIDVKAELEANVCAPFAASYLNGETPNPCIICNPSVKFRNLLAEKEKLGADFIATGHYARTAQLTNGHRALLKGLSENDQSYMLCRITRPQLDCLLLPLGKYAKTSVRQMAEEFNVPVARRPDSMEICFIPDKNYINWISRRTTMPGPGSIVFHGEVIGTHEGIFRYTVGQRFPGLIDGRKVYISAISASKNIVELALWEELFKTEVRARDFSWLSDIPDSPFRGSIKVRHTKWENPACTVYLESNGVTVICDDPVRAPAAGQSAVVYCGEQLIGGGFIVS